MRLRRSYLGIAALVVLVVAPAAIARNGMQDTSLSRLSIEDDPVFDRRVHYVGDIWMSLTNDGSIGSAFGPANPEDLATLQIGSAPSFQFPARTGHEYLFMGGLWIGGIVGTDTLASLGHEGWDALSDFNGFEYPVMTFDSLTGLQEVTCRYSDTSISPIDPDHVPLGIEVSQISRSWSVPPYDRFVLIEYSVKNIGPGTIQDAYIGVFADCDVSWWEDDVSGYLPQDVIAYGMDNNGDPSGGTSWAAGSQRGAFGIAPVLIEPAAPCTTFNWWNHRFSWGPRLASDTTWLGALGDGGPLTDRQKYNVLSNGEIDYDQIWSAVDFTTESWKPPNAYFAEAIAEGEDIRFVLGFGGFDIAVGDSVRIVVACVAGDSVHQEPANFVDNFDPADPQAFYDHLNFGDLIANASHARQAYLSGFDLHGASPAMLHAEPIGDLTVRCQWSAAPFEDLSGYRLYRRLAGSSEWSMVIDVPASVRGWEVSHSQLGVIHQYAVASVDTDGVEGPKSAVVSVSVGTPPVVPELGVDGGINRITIDWTVPTLHPEFAPLASLNLYRRAADQPEAKLLRSFPLEQAVQLLGSPTPASRVTPAAVERGISPPEPVPLIPPFVDGTIVPGKEYLYSASVSNTAGLEGSRSEEQSAAAMVFDRPGIILFLTWGRPDQFINRDSTRDFYTDWGMRYGFDTASADFMRPPSEAYDAMPADVIARYQVSVVVMEHASHWCLRPPMTDWLRTYMATGGRCIFVSRNTLPEDYGSDPVFYQDVLGIGGLCPDAIWEHSWLPWEPTFPIQFRSARSQMTLYPDLDVDSIRAFDNTQLQSLLDYGSILFGGGLIVGNGAVYFLTPDAEVLYSYVAGVPDTSSLHSLPVAFHRDSETGHFIFFNFPLSVMDREPALHVLDLALSDLGFDTTTPSQPSTTPDWDNGLISWLLYAEAREPDPSWDVNHDGRIDILDAVETISRQFRRPQR